MTPGRIAGRQPPVLALLNGPVKGKQFVGPNVSTLLLPTAASNAGRLLKVVRVPA